MVFACRSELPRVWHYAYHYAYLTPWLTVRACNVHKLFPRDGLADEPYDGERSAVGIVELLNERLATKRSVGGSLLPMVIANWMSAGDVPPSLPILGVTTFGCSNTRHLPVTTPVRIVPCLRYGL